MFDTREEAEKARDQLNQSPPEIGYGEGYLGGPTDGKWRVMRWRGLMAEDVGDATAYEHAYREAFERMALNHDGWRELEAIRFDAVELDGTYPDTKLVLLFRSVPQERFGSADPTCVFGIAGRSGRHPILTPSSEPETWRSR